MGGTSPQLDERTHARLRGRAAEHGRCVEAEVRAILDAAVNLPEHNLLMALHESMTEAGGVGLAIPERSDQPRPVDLPRSSPTPTWSRSYTQDAPDPTVLAWAQGIDPTDLTICVVTVEGIERGLARLPDGRRRRDRDQRWSRLVEAYADAIAVYNLPGAQHAASILVAAEASGRPMSLADAQIAGICRAGGHALATRNVTDFATTSGLTIVNPFIE
jgi:predicted nucleic acid-binding protein/plasmid stability protein